LARELHRWRKQFDARDSLAPIQDGTPDVLPGL
jgi:hypothetical protein